MRPLRIVFMGTPEFATASLQSLIDSKHQVVAVVTVPDKPAGRGLKLTSSPVKDLALEHQIPVLQPDKLRNPEFILQLQNLEADLFVVVAFRMLPNEVWTLPPMGTFNIHASLLPQYRGAAPIHHAIINGETETGLTTFLIDKEIDTGKIILQHKTPIDANDSTGSLYERLMEMSKPLVIETIDFLLQPNPTFISQNQLTPHNQLLKNAPKIFKEMGQLHPELSCENAHNLVRGLNPFPVATLNLLSPEKEVFQLKIFSSHAHIEGQNHSNQIATDGKNFLKFGFSNGWLEIHEMQLQSKKRMKVDEFLRGFRIDLRWTWV